MNIEIRNMTLPEVKWAAGLAAEEGWNPGSHDAETFYAADPGGFFVALIEGNPVGCISAVCYPDDFAFMGFYIVKAEFRSKGVWKPLWQAAKARAQGDIMGLEAETLYHGLCKSVQPGDNVYLDVPSTNTEAMNLAGDLGMREVFATVRMYRGGLPKFDESRVFGITSFELG